MATTHEGQIVYLKKIEGQIRGIQRMIEEGRYCIDILTQLHSITGAILKVEDNILKKHLEGCVTSALKGKSELDRQKKLDEVINLLSKFRKAV